MACAAFGVVKRGVFGVLFGEVRAAGGGEVRRAR